MLAGYRGRRRGLGHSSGVSFDAPGWWTTIQPQSTGRRPDGWSRLNRRSAGPVRAASIPSSQPPTPIVFKAISSGRTRRGSCWRTLAPNRRERSARPRRPGSSGPSVGATWRSEPRNAHPEARAKTRTCPSSPQTQKIPARQKPNRRCSRHRPRPRPEKDPFNLHRPTRSLRRIKSRRRGRTSS